MAVDVKGMEAKAKEVGMLIQSAINDTYGANRVGFCLMVFDFGPGGSTAYFSNGRREDMIKAISELLDHIKEVE